MQEDVNAILTYKKVPVEKIYWCSSLGKSPTVKCSYEVIYRLIKNGASTYWRLDKEKSTFKHVIGCPSVPQMTQGMLAKSPAFRRAVVDDKSVNIHHLERAALTPVTIRNSFTKHKLYRVKQDILFQNAEDYEDRYNKLQEWGEGFTKSNPDSMFSIVRDDGRSPNMHVNVPHNMSPNMPHI